MSRAVTLAVCQTGPVQRAAARAETVDRLIHLLETAAGMGAALAVFPEMALTTFFPRWVLPEDEIAMFFEPAMPDPDTARLFAAAARLRCGFVLGFCEAAEDGRFNTAVLVGRDGREVGRYRKVHVPGSAAPRPGETVHLERRYFEPGNRGFPVFDYDGLRIGMAICNDRRWPETYRMLMLNGAEVACIGYNTPLMLAEAPEAMHLRMLHNHLPMQAGAYQNTLWVAAAAKAGEEDGQALIGGSCIVAPTGEIVAQATGLGDAVIVHRADLDLIAACRRVNFDFAAYRRPDQYRAIAERAGP
ncbi:MAG: nitrilase-related carbon-nitrogen hydrolase [Gemmobacter sp.]